MCLSEFSFQKQGFFPAFSFGADVGLHPLHLVTIGSNLMNKL